jgi:hypothetical protein
VSNVNMTVNVDGDGSCGASPCLTHQVRVFYSELAEGKVFGPLSLDNAQALCVASVSRPDVVRAVVEMAGTQPQ